MYSVTIRKMFRHKDGKETLYEDPSQIRHERHTENLAARTARDPGVEWVEVEENTGRFKARASSEGDGLVHESLEVRGQTVKRKRSTTANTRALRRNNYQPLIWIQPPRSSR